MALRESVAVNHSDGSDRPQKPPMGKFRGAIDASPPYATIENANGRQTFITDSSVGNQAPEDQAGIGVDVTAKPSRSLSTLNKNRPLPIAPVDDRSITARPSATKVPKKQLGATLGPNA